jgi:hypothetical protein
VRPQWPDTDFNEQYDRPLFGVPGAWANTGLGGSVQAPVPDLPSTTATEAVVTPYASGYQNADMVAVSPDDVNVPSQTDLYGGSDSNLVPGIPRSAYGTTGGGKGHTHFGTGAS